MQDVISVVSFQEPARLVLKKNVCFSGWFFNLEIDLLCRMKGRVADGTLVLFLSLPRLLDPNRSDYDLVHAMRVAVRVAVGGMGAERRKGGGFGKGGQSRKNARALG